MLKLEEFCLDGLVHLPWLRQDHLQQFVQENVQLDFEYR